MARIRSIHPDACKSEKLAAAGAEAERCYWRLQTHCDDEGRCEDHPRLIWAALFPLCEDESPKTVDGHLERLAEVGLIVRYEVDGKRFLEVTQFGRFQHPQRPKASTIPAPSATTRVHVAEGSRTAQVHVSPGGGEGVGDGDRRGVGTDVVPAAPEATETVFAAWKDATGKNGRTVLSDKRRKVISGALKHYPLDDVIDAVRGWRHSPHHRGENDRHTVYNDLELLLRDAARIEKFRDLERGAGHAPPRMPPGGDATQRAVAAREGTP